MRPATILPTDENSRSARGHLCSAFLFAVSSVLYLAMACMVIPRYWFYRKVPPEVMHADDDATWWAYFVNGTDDQFLPASLRDSDDDLTWTTWYNESAFFSQDDVVFAVDRSNEATSVSKYMILYFFAALGFVATGLIEMTLARTPTTRSLYALMVVAAGFGLLSAILTNASEFGSDAANLISTNLWCLEAGYLVVQRFRGQWRDGEAYDADETLCGVGIVQLFWIADLAFLAGTLGDAFTSWIYAVGIDSLDLALSQIVCAIMWLVCAVVHLAVEVSEFGFEEVCELGALLCCKALFQRFRKGTRMHADYSYSKLHPNQSNAEYEMPPMG